MVFSEYVSTAAATATAFSRSVDQGASRNRDTAVICTIIVYTEADNYSPNLREAKKNYKNGLHEVVMKSDNSRILQHDC